MRSPTRNLIADGKPDNADIFRTRLSANGYEILTATDGNRRLLRARIHPELVLLHVMMPKMDGTDSAESSLPFMPIVTITAKTSTQDVVTALEASADEYVTKPVDHGALVARVKSMLRINDLSLGIGIAKGYATIGAIGFEGRLDYGAVGTVTNMAARLCGEAKGGQILTNRKTLTNFALVGAEVIGELSSRSRHSVSSRSKTD